MKGFQWVAMYVGRPFQQQDPSGANPPCWNMCKIGALTPSVIRDAVICSSQRCFDQRWLLLHTRRAAGWESTWRKNNSQLIFCVDKTWRHTYDMCLPSPLCNLQSLQHANEQHSTAEQQQLSFWQAILSLSGTLLHTVLQGIDWENTLSGH